MKDIAIGINRYLVYRIGGAVKISIEIVSLSEMISVEAKARILGLTVERLESTESEQKEQSTSLLIDYGEEVKIFVTKLRLDEDFGGAVRKLNMNIYLFGGGAKEIEIIGGKAGKTLGVYKPNVDIIGNVYSVGVVAVTFTNTDLTDLQELKGMWTWTDRLNINKCKLSNKLEERLRYAYAVEVYKDGEKLGI